MDINYLLFPLDCGWRFGGDVVAYAVYAAHFVDDFVADLGEELVGKVCPVGCHGIGRSDGTERYGTFVGAFVAHHAYALHRQQDYAGLPYFVVESGVAQTLDEDMIGILEHGHFFAGNLAENAHCQTGTGEGVALDEVFGHAELAAHCADFVLEQQAERFAQFEVHALGEAADVVVALYDGAGNRQ